MPAQYNDMIAGIFPGEVIIVENGKLLRHERAWYHREGVRNCDSDISMWPQPFRWRTITDQCWSGVLRLPSRLAPVAEGLVCPKSGEN